MHFVNLIISFSIRRWQSIIVFLIITFLSLTSNGQIPASKAISKDTSQHSKDTVHPKFDSLEAFIVRPRVMRPRVKGDTIEYNTENIVLQPNAVVEVLLGRLPGLQIDPSGNITYNGEKIQHLLVDGEDIFGSTPALVTRNFDASKIAKVQLLDRKSDQAVFTGIDDGIRVKTLNLVLKESEKNGYFGKVEAGDNADGYYDGDGLMAAFRDKEQFTALGLVSNTGVLGVNGNSASINFLNGNNDALGASAGLGIPHFSAASLHYANAWNGPADHIIGNYQFSHFYTNPTTVSQILTTEADSIYGQHQQSQSFNQQDQHWIYGYYDLVTNKKTAFRFFFHDRHSEGQNKLAAAGNSTFNDTLANASQRSIQDKVSLDNIGGSVTWKTVIGKQPQRVLSAGISQTKIDNSTSGFLYSLNQFYQANGSTQSVDTVDERKYIKDHSVNTSGNISFAEPLWKGAIVGMKYNISIIGNEPLQATFSRGDGKYEDFVDSLSNHLKIKKIDQILTFNLQGKSQYVSYIIGNDWLFYNYRQEELLKGSIVHAHHFNFAPRILLTYSRNSNTNIQFEYIANTIQPSITQLESFKDNSDPLHINLGNPDLQPSLNQNIKVTFHHFKTWIVNLGLSLGLVNDAISLKTTTDSLGRQISQPVNVDGGRTAEVNFSINRKIGELDAGFFTNFSYSRSINFVNSDLSRNGVYNSGLGLSLHQYIPDKYSFQISSNFNYFDAISSINRNSPTHYWTQNHSGAVGLFLLQGFEINTNVTYTWQEKTNSFITNTNVLLWNAFVSRNFMGNRFEVKLIANNILGQNSGITRSNIGNVNTENYTNILGRYWMLSSAYHFNHKNRGKALHQ